MNFDLIPSWAWALPSTFLVSILPVFFLIFVPFLFKRRQQEEDSAKKGKKKSQGGTDTFSVSSGWMSWFLCFSAGALLGDAFLHLIPTALGHDHHSEHSFFQSHGEHGHGHYNGLVILSGIMTFLTIELFSSSSDHHGHSHGHSHSHGRKVNGFLSLIADSIHNFTDGLTIAAAYCTSRHAGLSTTLAIFLHEIPHELGDYALLSRAGFDHSSILQCQFLTGAVAFVGTLLGLTLNRFSDQLKESFPLISFLSGSILPFSAGGFIYLALASIIPEILGDSRHHGIPHKLAQVSVFLAGLGLMYLLD